MKQEKEPLTFTKTIMCVVVLLYFIGALLGSILVVFAAIIDIRLGSSIDNQMFVAYAAYLGGPTATAIGFYAWKSKCENLLKIKYGNEGPKNFATNGNVDISTLANMGG